jgi:type IV pilus assembly protein PilB
VVTGPTGAGKTTTLYSCVNYLNDLETSIITAEEPVEYLIDGISQCSINPKIGLTFSETLRHIVRKDRDIIVMGEVRDPFPPRPRFRLH